MGRKTFEEIRIFLQIYAYYADVFLEQENKKLDLSRI
jgi:hypothetical protein